MECEGDIGWERVKCMDGWVTGHSPRPSLGSEYENAPMQTTLPLSSFTGNVASIGWTGNVAPLK